jgi:hypothetical protein
MFYSREAMRQDIKDGEEIFLGKEDFFNLYQ